MNSAKAEDREDGRADARWPILLTVLAGVLALLPVSLEIFWGTMPFAVIGGLTAVIVATLLLLPAIHLVLMRRARGRENSGTADVYRTGDDQGGR